MIIDIINRLEREIKHLFFLRADNKAKNRNLIGGLTDRGQTIENEINAKIESKKKEIADLQTLKFWN